ncbi:DUF6090 family protein [Winogradskyella flava]|uniref:DUF6090 family protein n=1 Tax=Winogradskyella flava TaxID=1884876 RepID=UPI0024914EAB|nr:DUF6090 family protein [Winogradskyella flava]
MIKFFRKIRQNLLSENKFSKYLLYAIGEIILVVIGILIALQINTWNQNISLNKQEIKALKNLKEDFKFNLEALKNASKTNDKNIHSCLVILNHTGKRYSKDFKMDSIINDVMSSPGFYPNNGFLNDLINSGNLDILKNDLLRNKLSSWQPTIQTIYNRQEAAEEFDEELIRYIFKNGSWLNVDQVNNDEIIDKIKLPESGFVIDNNNMLKSLEFENRVENQAVYYSILKDRYNKCLKLNEDIIQLLESELGDKQ